MKRLRQDSGQDRLRGWSSSSSSSAWEQKKGKEILVKMYHFENNIRWTRGNNWKIKTLEVSLLASHTPYPQRQGSVWQHNYYEGIQTSAEINRRNWMCATMTLKGTHSAHFHVSLFILGIYQGSFAWLIAENNVLYWTMLQPHRIILCLKQAVWSPGKPTFFFFWLAAPHKSASFDTEQHSEIWFKI